MGAYQIEILNNSLTRVAVIRNTPELDKAGYWLMFTSRLSAWGECRFRVGTKDPLFTATGDIFKPFKYHVRIKRFGVVVWQGVIVDNPHRTRNYVEILAYEYLYLLDRVPVRHDAADGAGAENYRALRSGTIASFITAMLVEAKTDMGAPITNMTTGTIDNPSFPADFKDANGTALTGTWTFSDAFQMKFDYQSVYYVIEQLANVAQFDFELTKDFQFNFRTRLGSNKRELVFRYGTRGNIEDYDAPRSGKGMANYITAIAADNEANILHVDEMDTASVGEYGKIWAPAAYADVKNINVLRTRVREELRYSKDPAPEIHAFVDPRKSYPLGQYVVGDTVTYDIQDHVISVREARRIVGIDVKVHTTGKEQVRHVTNIPRDGQ